MPDLSYMPTGQVAGMSDADQTAALVAHLLASLDISHPAPPAPTSMGQRIFGSLGDAIQSMAAVRSGRGPLPVGPFAASQLARQNAYEQQLRASNQADVD